MKDPNTPLMAPGLLTGKIKASDLDHNKNIRSNGYDEVDTRTQLHSKDFSKIDSTYLDDYSNSAGFALKTTEITTTKKESTIKNTYVKPSKPKAPVVDEGPAVKASIADKKSVVKMEPVKDFGNFSSLMAPALLSGKFLAQNHSKKCRFYLFSQDGQY